MKRYQATRIRCQCDTCRGDRWANRFVWVLAIVGVAAAILIAWPYAV